jgi:putative ABC transport system permease protein
MPQVPDVRSVSPMRGYLSPLMAYCQLRAMPGGWGVSVAAIGLSVSLAVAILMLAGAVKHSFGEHLAAMAGRADLTVAAPLDAPFREDVTRIVESVLGVEFAVPLVRATAFPDDGSGEMLTVFGVDLTSEATVRMYEAAGAGDRVVDDPLALLNEPQAILIGEEFAATRGWVPGLQIPLVTNSGIQKFILRGLLRAKGAVRALGGRVIVMDLFAAERNFTGDGRINRIDLVLEEEADLERAKQAIAAVLPAGLSVEQPFLRQSLEMSASGLLDDILWAFSFLAVVVSSLICYQRFTRVFAARVWEIGLMRAVGLRIPAVLAELLKEAFLLGLAGTVVGLAVGCLIGIYGLPAFSKLDSTIEMVPEMLAEPRLRLDALLVGALVGLGAAVASAVVPALRYSRKRPVAALILRGREEVPPSFTHRRTLVVGIGLLVAAVGIGALQRRVGGSALGNGLTILVAAGLCALSGPFSHAGGLVLRRLFERLFGAAGRFSIEQMLTAPGRLSLMVATIGRGLGTVTWIGIQGESFQRTLGSTIDRAFPGELVITSGHPLGPVTRRPLDERTVDEVLQVEGVEQAAGHVIAQARYGDRTVLLNAVDRACFLDERVCSWSLAGGAGRAALERVAQGEAVLVSPGFAKREGVDVGDVLELDSPTGKVRLPIVGIGGLNPVDDVSISRELRRRAWYDHGVVLIYAAVAPSHDVNDVAAALSRSLGERHSVAVRHKSDLVEYWTGQAKDFFAVVYSVEVIAFLLVLVAVGDTIAAGIFERRRILATMRAVGVQRSTVMSMVFLEGLAIAALGLALALVMGISLGSYWALVQFPAVVGWQIELNVPTVFVAGTTLTALLVCLGGAALPAIRLGNMRVGDALRTDA